MVNKIIKYFMIVLTLSGVAFITYAQQDPTAPLGWMEVEKSEPTKKTVRKYNLPRLESIVCISEQPCYAVLNNKVVKKGSKINGYQITKISDSLVTVSRGSRQWQLTLFPLDVKKK